MPSRPFIYYLATQIPDILRKYLQSMFALTNEMVDFYLQILSCPSCVTSLDDYWRHQIRATKNLQNSEFSEGRLFDKIEWGPPLKTEKLLWVMKKTEKARIEWGGSHSILATGARRNPELRGGSHSILSKRRPLRGGSHSILAKRRNPEYPEKWNFLSLNSVPAYNSVVHLVIFWCVW